MNLVLGTSIALREIWNHKFRSFLTMLGVILGVACLLATMALLNGIAKGMRETLANTGGLERIQIESKEPSEHLANLAFLSPGITLADVRALRRGAPLIDLVAAESNTGAAISHGGITIRQRVNGGMPEWAEMGKYTIQHGRMISQLDLDRGHRVAVLGHAIVSQLWPNDPNVNPVGQTIWINGRSFSVIGTFPRFETEQARVQRERGLRQAASAGSGRSSNRGRGRWDPYWHKNSALLIPITTMIQEFKSAQLDANNNDAGPNYRLDVLSIRVRDTERIEEAIAQARKVIETTHRGIDDFQFSTREDWFESIERSVQSTRASGGLIAAISLLVGGIGIANIMLASITERVREIGIRCAVGAKASDIFSQFLVESTFIGMIGGILGLAASLGMIQILVLVAPNENAPIIDLQSVFLSFGAAVAIGILSGIYPAWRAARLNPIEALRYQ